MEAECALAAAENEVLGALDGEQRRQLYSLLQLATTESPAACAAEEPGLP